jgi:hypothetical protein
LDGARSERDAAIEAAQKSAEGKIAETEEVLHQAEADDGELIRCAAEIADQMVEILCSTSLGEVAT